MHYVLSRFFWYNIPIIYKTTIMKFILRAESSFSDRWHSITNIISINKIMFLTIECPPLSWAHILIF